MREKTKKTIEMILEKNPQGMTMQEITDKAKFTRNTTAVHLAELIGEGRIRIRQVGNAKIHYLVK